jgi:hypothetical protein
MGFGTDIGRRCHVGGGREMVISRRIDRGKFWLKGRKRKDQRKLEGKGKIVQFRGKVSVKEVSGKRVSNALCTSTYMHKNFRGGGVRIC